MYVKYQRIDRFVQWLVGTPVSIALFAAVLSIEAIIRISRDAVAGFRARRASRNAR